MINEKGKCMFYKKEICEDCNSTEKEFTDGSCFMEDSLAELAKGCPVCTKGILNPTFDKKLVCDKCCYQEK